MIIRGKYLIAGLVALPVIGLIVVWLGVVGVGASGGHWAVTDWFLHLAMRNSVRTAALSVEAPPLDDPALLPLAAGHYETGCAICHGSPAQPRSEAVLAMLPPPPDLKGVVDTWTDEELFTIIQHGVKYTGMPAWPTQLRPDEAWAMVAFLRELPQMDAARYHALSGLDPPPMLGEASPMPITCESCHSEQRLSAGSLIPRLAGQSEAYLLESLRAYADGRRPSGAMGVAVGLLSDDALSELARDYARQRKPELGPESKSETANVELLEKGKILAEQGRPADRIPACLSCHEKEGRNPLYPRLTGQSAPYMARQLKLFNEAVRGGTAYSHLMTEVARKLTAEDIAAVSAYFAERDR